MPLRIGETFAGYTILRLLGSGGMGEVYLVQHPRLPRQDALKVLPPDVSADSEYRARFNREADLASTLWHPHIVGVHDRGEYEGQLWISMDFVDGLDAAQLLVDRYPAGMPVDGVVRIVTAVASALDAAHKQRLLHRDVKPANIMMTHLDDDGEQRVLLTDFGIARDVSDISGLTTTNMTVGTVAYSAPEQLMGDDIDGRADQYALAATAYHMLTASHLFPHSNPAVVISRHLNSPPPVLSKSRPDLAVLDLVLAKALAKQPNDRFARCAEFARALAAQSNAQGTSSPVAPTQPSPLLPGSGLDASQPTTSESPSPPSRSSGTRPRWLLPAAASAAVLLAGVAALTWHPWERARSSATTTTTSSPAEASPSPSVAQPLPPDPPLFPAKSIDRLLLTADQLSTVLGVKVTSDPSLGGFTLAMDTSSYGTSDHAGQVTPRSCVGVVFTGEHEVYGATFEAIKTQIFGNLYGQSSGHGPYLLQQTAVVFESVEEAQRVLTSAQAQWDACSKTEVDATLGYENGRTFTLGNPQSKPDLITIAMASNDGLYGPDACQQALGLRDNVVVETRTCEAPHVTAGPDQGFPKDPAWAVADAERVATAMLENVTP
jgi:serine/threonine-protein kinase